MNCLIVLSGVPGSGKSYFSNALKSQVKRDVYVISSDQLRLQMFGDQKDLSHDPIIWEEFYRLASEYSKKKDAIVVLDATNAKKMYRLGCIERYKKLYDQIDLVCFQLEKEIVIKQNKERDNPIPEDALLRLINEFEMPDDEEKTFFDHINIIKSHRTKQIINRYLK